MRTNRTIDELYLAKIMVKIRDGEEAGRFLCFLGRGGSGEPGHGEFKAKALWLDDAGRVLETEATNVRFPNLGQQTRQEYMEALERQRKAYGLSD